MIRTLAKFLKWFAITLGSLLFLGFLYVWFIMLAKPKEASSAVEISDHDWRIVPMHGQTSCSDGSPYSIFIKKGNSANLIIHFSGGGACWDNITCAAPITLASVFDGDSRQLKSFYFPNVTKFIPAILTGLLDNAAESNPFKDWNVVFIPYCTGDLHIGNTTNSYSIDGRQFEIRHNGRNNSLEALQWVFDNFDNPGKVLVSGESAGAYGSAFWAPHVAAHYESNKIYQLSDGSLLASNRWKEIMDTVWKAESESYLKFKIGKDIFEDALLQQPDELNDRIKHLHSNTVYDAVLTKFSAALNHTPTGTNEFIDDWSLNMRGSMKRLVESRLDYHYFLSDCKYDSKGHTTPHTLAGFDYYNCPTDQISFPEWLKKNVIEDDTLSVGGRLLGALNK
jgi:hypothetical protein